jgi:TRAP-type C4-dicarboxylate transport system substrate-binding protein
MKRKKMILTVASVFFILVLVGGGATTAHSKKLTWKYAHFGPSKGDSGSATMNWYLNELKKRSEGRLEVKGFWNQALCPAREQPDGLKAGLFEVTCVVPAYYPSKMPLYNMAYLPSIFPIFVHSHNTWLSLNRIVDEWAQTPLLKAEFAKWNALYLSNMVPQFYELMGNVRISNLEELKGKRIRVIGGLTELMNKAGGIPVSLIAPEIFDALNKGTLDAVAHAHNLMDAMGFYEVSEYYTPSVSLGHMPVGLLVSIKDYEALPEDIKGIFQALNKETPEVSADFADYYLKKSFEKFKKAGIEFVEFSAEDQQKLRDMAKGIWKKYVDDLEKRGLPGRKAFNSLQDIIKKHVPGYEPYYL